MLRSRYRSAALIAALAAVMADVLVPSGRVSVGLYHLGAVIAVVLLWTAIRQRPSGRGPWFLIGSGVALWVAGDVVWDTSGLVDYSVGYLPDVVYLAGYPLLAYGLICLVRQNARQEWTAGLLDAFGVAVTGAVATWVYLSSSDESSGARGLVDALYPVADVGLLAATVWLVMTPGGNRSTVRWLAAAAFATLTVDVLYLVGTMSESWSFVASIEACFPLSYLLFGFAAAQREPAAPDACTITVHPAMHRARIWFLGATLLGVAVLGGMAPVRTGLSHWMVPTASGCIGMAVLMRFVHTLNRLEQLSAELHRRATTDSLTGTASRSEFFESGDEIVRHATDRTPVGALVIDVDRFKQLNDLVGHGAGDDVLAEIARRCRTVIRPADVFGRIGGDEFAMVVEGLSAAQLASLGARLCAAVADRPIEAAGRPVTVSISVGSAQTVVPITLADLLRDADSAMYESKSAGRNVSTVSGAQVAVPSSPGSLDEALALRSSTADQFDATSGEARIRSR